MNEWINHPAMKSIDPVKLELIKMAAKQTSDKTGNQMATTMMALITAARKHHILFSSDEFDLILHILKDGKSKEEQQQIDQMIQMVKMVIQNQHPHTEN